MRMLLHDHPEKPSVPDIDDLIYGDIGTVPSDR